MKDEEQRVSREDENLVGKGDCRRHGAGHVTKEIIEKEVLSRGTHVIMFSFCW